MLGYSSLPTTTSDFNQFSYQMGVDGFPTMQPSPTTSNYLPLNGRNGPTYGYYVSSPTEGKSREPLKRRRCNDALENDSPTQKVRATEDKVATSLRNFHITTAEEGARVDPNWFFVRRPQETLEEIDGRLSSSSDEESEHSEIRIDGDGPKLKLSKEYHSLIKNKMSGHLLKDSYGKPNPCMDLILWSPPIALPAIDKPEPYVTEPRNDDDDESSHIRRKYHRRHFVAGPIIEELVDDDAQEMNSQSLGDDSSSAMDIDV